MVSERHTEEFEASRLKEMTALVECGEGIEVPEELVSEFRTAFNIEDEGQLHIVRYQDAMDDEYDYRIALLPQEGGRARKSYGLREQQLIELMPGRAEQMELYHLHERDVDIEVPTSVVQDVTDLLADVAEKPWGGPAAAAVEEIVETSDPTYQLSALLELYVSACGAETYDDPESVGKLTADKETKSLSGAMRRVYGAMHDALVIARLRQMDPRDYTLPDGCIYSAFENMLQSENELSKVDVAAIKHELESA